MEKVALGTKVKRLGIQRLLVSEGAKCRAILLDNDPRMKHIAYDESRKVRVEVDQDMCIEYGLNPSPTFYYLVAKLNTDLNGNVIGDQFTVEYLQLSESLNNKFAEQVSEMGMPKSLSLTKVKKSGDNGRDFSYIETTPSAKSLVDDNPSLKAKINELKSNQEFIANCWKMIDASTSITKERYIEMLHSDNSQSNIQQIQAPKSKSALPQSKPAQPASLPSNEFEGDFGDAEGFEDFG